MKSLCMGWSVLPNHTFTAILPNCNHPVNMASNWFRFSNCTYFDMLFLTLFQSSVRLLLTHLFTVFTIVENREGCRCSAQPMVWRSNHTGRGIWRGEVCSGWIIWLRSLSTIMATPREKGPDHMGLKVKKMVVRTHCTSLNTFSWFFLF